MRASLVSAALREVSLVQTRNRMINKSAPQLPPLCRALLARPLLAVLGRRDARQWSTPDGLEALRTRKSQKLYNVALAEW